MKGFLPLLSFLLFGSMVIAQSNCLPDTTVLDSIFIIHPKPFDSEFSPEGGIRDSVCLEQQPQFTFPQTDRPALLKEWVKGHH